MLARVTNVRHEFYKGEESWGIRQQILRNVLLVQLEFTDYVITPERLNLNVQQVLGVIVDSTLLFKAHVNTWITWIHFFFDRLRSMLHDEENIDANNPLSGLNLTVFPGFLKSESGILKQE